MTTWFDRAPEPVPYADRLGFWERVKARRAERLEQEARENMDISKWLAEKAPTSNELVAQDTVDTFKRWDQNPVILVDGEMAAMRLHRIMEYLSEDVLPLWEPRPISSARRTPTRDAVLEKIRRNTVDVEPVLDVAEMIVAHRNGATALERPMTIDEQCESPVWEELVERMWDPTHERGPRERDWVRQQHKRQQPERQSRAQRKGKR